MGLPKKILKATLYGSTAAASGFFLYTRNSKFVPLTPTDAIFKSEAYRTNNPNKHPATQDWCIKKVPLSAIKPQLLEKKERLTEAFCAGVWTGYGYAYQRKYLEGKYRDSSTSQQLWDTKDLATATYEPGTQITDHFEVVEKTAEHITVRCGDSPRTTGLRPSDGLFEMSAKINHEEGVVEFGMKSVFYNGVEKGEDGKGPMPEPVVFLHQQYTKLWMETASRSCLL